jgi:hypothetical protein
MDEVEVDIKQVRLAGLTLDDMVLPDLLDDGAGLAHLRLKLRARGSGFGTRIVPDIAFASAGDMPRAGPDTGRNADLPHIPCLSKHKEHRGHKELAPERRTFAQFLACSFQIFVPFVFFVLTRYWREFPVTNGGHGVTSYGPLMANR